MDDQTTAVQVVVIAFVAVALGFFVFVHNGGFLALAIERAIEDGRVIVGMTKDDVISSWGHPYHAEKPAIQPLDIWKLTTLTWTYENPHHTVYFNSDGIVIWVAD